jgi:hypothetical protein
MKNSVLTAVGHFLGSCEHAEFVKRPVRTLSAKDCQGLSVSMHESKLCRMGAKLDSKHVGKKSSHFEQHAIECTYPIAALLR